MENLFNKDKEYMEYVKSKEDSLKNRHIVKEVSYFGGEDASKKGGYDINEFEEMPKEYGVKLEYFKYNDEEKRYWDNIRVTVLKNGEEKFSFIRDYSHISMCYAHNNNMDYIIFTGEHYQGFSIYNLSKETFYSYIPTRYAWCPSEILDYDEDLKELRTYGCHWGAEFEWRYYKILDLDNPSFDNYETIEDN